TRVTAIDPGEAGTIGVTVSRDGVEVRLRPRFLVAADGHASSIRRMAGIECRRTRISQLVGYRVEGAPVVHPGFAHVLLGAQAPALVSPIASDVMRVMFDFPGRRAPPGGPRLEMDHVEALPVRFRDGVRRAVETQQPLVCVSYSIVPAAVVRGRV